MQPRDPMRTLGLIFRLSRPLFLGGAALIYALGAGIARYLGNEIDWGVYFLGQTWVTLVQLSTHYLNEYFDSPEDADNANRTPFSGGSGALGRDGLPRSVALTLAYSCLAGAASVTALMLVQGQLSPASLLFLVLTFIGALFYSVPPVRLVSSGYGELTTSFLVASLLPALSFSLQTGDVHRLLAMVTSPLVMIHIAMMLAFELPDYLSDFKHGKRTLLVRLGWEAGMHVHNLLLLSAYVLLGLALLLGLPISIGLPAMLTLPIGLLQIWQMRRIAVGGRPNWNALTLTAVVVFATPAYLLTIAFWTR